MKILFALDKFRSREGGADRLAKGVVAVLVAAGHEVLVVEAGAKSEDIEWEGARIACRRLRRPRLVKDGDYVTLGWNSCWRRILEKEVIEFSPELILTQNILTPASVYVARKFAIKVAVFFHGYRALSPTFFYGQDALQAGKLTFRNIPFRYKLKWPIIKKAMKLYLAAYQAADIVVANSEYVAKVIERYYGRGCEVLYPIVDLEPLQSSASSNREGPVLFVKPQPIKGVDTLLLTAQEMPESKFIVVGAASKKVKKLLGKVSNIEYRGWVDDMDALYAEVSMILGPSHIPEPFGRVFVEAGLRGVPAVASDFGGIPEAVGAGGALVKFDAPASEWAAAINDVLSEEKYDSFCNAARENAGKLVAEHNDERLCETLGLEASVSSGV